MILVVVQDGMQLALVTKLPQAYVAANQAIQPALVAFGESLAYIIQVLLYASVLNGVGTLVISMALVKAARIPKWIALLGITASSIAIIGTFGSVVAPRLAVLGVGTPIGILAIVLIWIPALGIVMWRRSSEADAA